MHLLHIEIESILGNDLEIKLPNNNFNILITKELSNDQITYSFADTDIFNTTFKTEISMREGVTPNEKKNFELFSKKIKEFKGIMEVNKNRKVNIKYNLFIKNRSFQL
jgi:hypothetical protein